MNGNAPILVPSCARLRVSILLPLLFLLALVPGLTAQVPGPIFKAPDQVVERIMTAQVLACQVADTASGKVLAGLDVALQRMIQEQEDLVRRTVADSAPGLAAEKTFAESEARLKPLEAELDLLLTRRNEINSSQQIYEDSISTATQGDAPPGTKSRLEQLDDDLSSYNVEHARFDAELKKVTDADHWLQGRDDQLKADMDTNRTRWARVRDERRGIMRRIHTARYNPQYQALVTEEEALDIRIAELQEKVKPLREARDTAKRTLADVNLKNIKKLEQLHEINGFTHQYLSNARDCVERRRGQLAQNVPPPAAGDMLSGTASGRWSGGCKYKGAEGYVPGRPLTIGGTVNFQFDGAGGVSGTFVANSSEFGVTSFPVVGTLSFFPDADPGRKFQVENGMGGGTGWSGTWQGQFDTIDGQFKGHGFNAPILTIQTSQWGETECVATWSVP